jgi:hypothetical protein
LLWSAGGVLLFLAKAAGHVVYKFAIQRYLNLRYKAIAGESDKSDIAPLTRLELVTHWLTAS